MALYYWVVKTSRVPPTTSHCAVRRPRCRSPSRRLPCSPEDSEPARWARVWWYRAPTHAASWQTALLLAAVASTDATQSGEEGEGRRQAAFDDAGRRDGREGTNPDGHRGRHTDGCAYTSPDQACSYVEVAVEDPVAMM